MQITPKSNIAQANRRQPDIEVPTSITPGELRQIAEAARTPQPNGGKRVDVDKIPFGVEIEMEGFDRNVGATVVNGLEPWSVHPQIPRWKMVEDQSLANWNKGIGGEAVSPPMTLEDGRAVRQIKTVVQGLIGSGGKTSNNCGLHVHVDASVLGAKGLANLMKMALEQEQALFKLSQNGQPQHRGTIPGAGYRHNEMFYYTKPLGQRLPDTFSVTHAGSVNEFRNALYGQIPPRPDHPRPPLPAVNDSNFRPDHRDSTRYFGINFNSYWYRGTVEFRLFNATTDPDQIVDDVKLAIGMVASAANDDYTYLAANPLVQNKPDAPVSREAFDYFLSKVAPDPGLQKRLLNMFVQGGGKFIEDKPITDGPVLNAAYLLRSGRTLQVEGKDVTSPLEIASQLKAGSRPVADASTGMVLKSAADLDALAQDVTGLGEAFGELGTHGARLESSDGQRLANTDGLLQTVGSKSAAVLVLDNGSRIPLEPDQVKPMLFAQTGRTDRLSKDIQARLSDATELANTQLELRDSKGQILTPAQAAVLSARDGAVVVSNGADSVAVGSGETQLTLPQIRGLQAGDRSTIDEPRRTALQDLDQLWNKGYTVDIGHGHTRWAPALTVALAGAGLTLHGPDDGPTTAIASPQEMREALIEQRRSDLPAATRADYDTAVKFAADRGYSFGLSGQKATAHGSLPQLDVLVGCPGNLELRADKRNIKIGGRAQLQTLLAVELNQLDKLNEPVRAAVADADGLRARRASFYNAAGETLTLRGELPLTLQRGELQIVPPDGSRRIPTGDRGLSNLQRFLSGDKVDSGVRDVLDRVAMLTTSGFKVQFNDQGRMVDATQAEMVVLGTQNVALRIVDPQGGTVDATGPSAFIRAADERLSANYAVTPEQKQVLDTFQTLIADKRVAAFPQARPAALANSQELPWLLQSGESIRINAPADLADADNAAKVAVPVRNWDELTQLVADETKPAAETGTHAAILTAAAGLKGKGVQFYHIADEKNQRPIALNSALVSQLQGEGVKAHLPKRIFWKYLFRKEIVVNNDEQITRLAAKVNPPTV